MCCKGEKHAGHAAWTGIRSLTEIPSKIKPTTGPPTGPVRIHWLRGGSGGAFCAMRMVLRIILFRERTIKPLGLHFGEIFRQFNASPSFSLIRLETSGAGNLV